MKVKIQHELKWIKQFQTIWNNIEKRFLPDSAWQSNPLTFWRERILFTLCFMSAVGGPILLIPAFNYLIREKIWLPLVVDICSYLTLVSLLFVKDWPLKIRGGIACLILYLFGILITIMLGPIGGGHIWLFGATVMVSVMVGGLAAFWMLCISAASLGGVSFLVAAGSLKWAAEMEGALEKWIVLTICFLFLNIFVTVAITFIINGLKRALIKEREISTSLRQSQERYRNAQRRFLTVLNSLKSEIYVVDMQSCEILFMNQHMIERYGNDFTGGLCWKALKGRSERCNPCVIDQMAGKDGFSTDVHVVEQHDPVNQKWYINHDRPIEWTDGRMAKLKIVTDVTDLKKMEKELRQSQKMEAIGTLAGGIAHDFNNILSSIIGFTELAVEDLDPDTPAADNLNEVLIAGKRAKDLIKQILAFARQSDQEVEPVQINAIVKEVLKLIRSAIPASIDIQSKITSDALVMGNATEIHQVVMNLCTNAAHAMGDKPGRLSISLADDVVTKPRAAVHSHLRPGTYLKLTVADTGTGIVPEHINTVFEPYFTTKSQGEGTGIGLAVVLGIVESYGGKIAVESKPGRGTRFDIYLPIIKRHHQTESSTAEKIPNGTERILLVDDEAAIVKMVQRSLTRLGYDITTRTSSIEALELFQTKPNDFDLIITDYAMPNMTGETLAEEMLKIRKEIPIILCTGYSRKISPEEAKYLGFRAFVHKPVARIELSNTIRRVLDTRPE